jgi:hypothetical protein
MGDIGLSASLPQAARIVQPLGALAALIRTVKGMLTRLCVVLCVLTAACGGDDKNQNPECPAPLRPNGETCIDHNECCSGLCGTDGACGQTSGQCAAVGATCVTGADRPAKSVATPSATPWARTPVLAPMDREARIRTACRPGRIFRSGARAWAAPRAKIRVQRVRTVASAARASVRQTPTELWSAIR